MRQFFGDALLYGFIGVMGVLVIMNASSFATAAKPVFGFITSESTLLTGSGYQRAK